jgi:AcrR family transcriptional regulator
MAKKTTKSLDISAEEKIKNAARKVFTEKGYAATRTRDIAEEAGINLALLNYYFRSKEKLFEQIMMEKVQKMFGVLAPVLMNETLSLDQKIDLIAENYIDMLVENPDLPIFVLSEIRNNPERFASMISSKKLLTESSLVKQLSEIRPDLSPLHIIMSLLGMSIFPFIGKPVFIGMGHIKPKDFDQLMAERKKLIPKWIKAMLKAR